ncbi:MAG: 8-amino-7-oxononanoate synthase [Thiotrichales bacterium]
MKKLHKTLQTQREQSLYRQRRISETPQQPEMHIDGRKVISFCSNDYLGLANHPKVIERLIEASKQFGVGAGAAHLINGHSICHHRLEEALAEFTGYPRALLFSTGYMANLGIAQALLEPGDAVFADRLNHASLLDGARLSGARLYRYLHNDIESLDSRLTKNAANDRLIMTDAVFSMDGDLAPLPRLVQTAAAHNTWLMIDDAHGFGVLGEDGRGSLAHHGLKPGDIQVYMATLGKAIGVAGAFVAGSEDLIEYLIQTARSYIYTTAMPPAVAAATLASLELVQNEPERREVLAERIGQFRQGAAQLDLPLLESETAIQGIVLGDNHTTLDISRKLFASGLLVTAIRPPTVPKGSARLRITLSAAHTPEQVEQLLSVLGELLPAGS